MIFGIMWGIALFLVTPLLMAGGLVLIALILDGTISESAGQAFTVALITALACVAASGILYRLYPPRHPVTQWFALTNILVRFFIFHNSKT